MSKVERREPSRETAQGFTKAKYLTEEQIEGIIEALAEGVPKQQAALKNETSWTQFKFRYERDPELKAQVEEAIEVGKPAFQEMLRQTGYWHVFVDKNYKAWKDWAMIHLPEFEALRTQRFEHAHSGVVEIEAKLAQYTTEELEAILAAERAKMLDEHPVIELPQKTQAA